MANIDFGTGLNTPTGDLCPSAIEKLNARLNLLGKARADGGTNITTYQSSFNGVDNTPLGGFEGWTLDSNSTAQWLSIVDNDIAVTGTINFQSTYTHPTGADDYEWEFTAYLDATPTGSNTKYAYPVYLDKNNYIVMNFANNNYVLQSKVSGVTADIRSYANFTFATDVSIKIRVQGLNFRIYYNGAEIADSVAANGGLGFAIPSALATRSKVALSGVNSSPLPAKFIRSMSITSIPDDNMVVSASVSMINATPGRQRISIVGAKQGNVTQPQASVVSSSSQVVQNWVNLTLNGDAISGDLPELPQSIEGDNVKILIRDKVNPSITTTAALRNGVPVQWHASKIDFGLNTTGGLHYGRAMEFVDFAKNTSAGVTDGGPIFHTPIFAQHCTLTPPSGSTQYMSYDEMGMDDGWPTKVPAGVGVWPANLKFALKCSPGASGFTDDQAGVYDVQFAPGLDWFHSGASHVAITNYNLAAGTAVMTITANSGSGQSSRFIFNSYNGVANKFPPAGQRVFKMIKRGQDAASAFTATTLSSWIGLTSAAKTDNTTYRGCLRFMSNDMINRPYSSVVKENYTRKSLPDNRLGFLERGGVISIVEKLDACKRIRCNMYLNIPDTADPSLVLETANYLKNNMPAGMKVFVEYSNEIVFNYQQGFFQTNELLRRTRENGLADDQTRIQLARDIKAVVAVPFASVFGIDNPRWNLIVGEQAAKYALNSEAQQDANVASLLDEGDLYLYARGMCVACYVGNGYTYSDVSPDNGFMSKASRDKAGVDNAGFLNDYFAAQKVMSAWTRDNYWNSFANALARYAVKKGFAVGRYMPVAYEYSWQHSNMSTSNKVSATGYISGNTLTITANNNGPIRAGDVLTKSDIIAGTKVLAQLTQDAGAAPGKAGTYSVDTTHATATTSGTITSTTNLYASAAGTLLGQALRDPRAGEAQNYQDSWIRNTGGIACHFDHIGGTGTLYNITSGSYWGYADYIGREALDEPYISTNRDMIANGWS
ncbi:hypothetical protein [Sphingomonas echinoides]|uniref:hypothetical protein n=1 Tax=Sphingomonas echinoides TaxID=59803 RepID=UPI0024135974|nr:hypothetical protein [Sphingomonas echinoides]